MHVNTNKATHVDACPRQRKVKLNISEDSNVSQEKAERNYEARPPDYTSLVRAQASGNSRERLLQDEYYILVSVGNGILAYSKKLDAQSMKMRSVHR